jgi:dihydrofolate reductase
MTVKLALVVARGTNGVIGADGTLPWKLSSDLKHFKAVTMGKPVIMGRKTWASIGRPLPGRPNLVITRDANFLATGASVWSNLDVAVAAARAMASSIGGNEVCIIGGGQLYAQTIDIADRLYVTEVDATPKGDAMFPSFSSKNWREVSREIFPAGNKDDHSFDIVTFDRKAVDA